MKHWYLIPLGAVVGVIAGSWGPREGACKLSNLTCQIIQVFRSAIPKGI